MHTEIHTAVSSPARAGIASRNDGRPDAGHGRTALAVRSRRHDEAKQPSTPFVQLMLGGNMAPTIEPGTPILIEPGHNPLTRGCGIYALRYAGQPGLVIRRVQPLPFGGARLIHDNKHFVTEELSASDLQAVVWIGKVVGAVVKL